MIKVGLIICLLITSLLWAEEQKSLKGGWFTWAPYQFASKTPGIKGAEGLDIRLTDIISTQADIKVNNTEFVEWADHVEGLKNGTKDIAAVAAWTQERTEFVHYSDPYRYEENALYIPRRQSGDWGHVENVDSMIKHFDEHDIKVGFIKGYAYADTKLNQWIADPKNQDKIVFVSSEFENVDALVEGKTDCYVGDRIAAATAIWKNKQGPEIGEVNLGLKIPLHFMFSKKTVSLETVDKFNQAIKEVASSAAYKAVIQEYFHPVILMQTVDTWWFMAVDYLGTFAFAVSGLIIAYRERATIFAAFLFAILPALGGSLSRDILLQRQPIGVIQTPAYVFIILVTLVGGYIGIRLLKRFFKVRKGEKSDALKEASKERAKKFVNTTIMIFDALGIASFTVSGIIICVVMKVQPLWLWGPFFAFLTGAGGGIMRDLLTKSRYIQAFDRSSIFPEIIALWGLFLSIFLNVNALNLEAEPIKYAVMATIAGAFITRLVVYNLGIRNVLYGLYDEEEGEDDIL